MEVTLFSQRNDASLLVAGFWARYSSGACICGLLRLLYIFCLLSENQMKKPVQNTSVDFAQSRGSVTQSYMCLMKVSGRSLSPGMGAGTDIDFRWYLHLQFQISFCADLCRWGGNGLWIKCHSILDTLNDI